MKVNVFSLTRDRIGYTDNCFNSLHRCKNGYPFEHYVLDNGSVDDTKEYLGATISRYKGLVCIPYNLGLHRSASVLCSIMEPCDLVIKVDNDCFFRDSNAIKNIVSIYEVLFKRNELYIISPKVSGINKQPRRGVIKNVETGNQIFTLGQVGQIGGLCMTIPYKVFKSLKFNINLPMARGLDSSICAQAVAFGYTLAYIENMSVDHYETTNGQIKRYPDYFKRKKLEEAKPFA